MFFIVIAVTNYMVVETSLPNIFAILLIAKTLECRYKLRAYAIGSFNICRDRRPRLSVIGLIFIFLYPKQKMDVVNQTGFESMRF